MNFILFILPAAFANMAPVFVKKVNFLNYPVDLNFKFRQKRLFGKNKTFRGLFFGVLAGALGGILILDKIILGTILGFLALFGDLLGSLIKRQFNIAPGQMCFPLDQLDWVIGPLFLLNIQGFLNYNQCLYLVIISLIFHPVVNLLGYYIGLKSNKF